MDSIVSRPPGKCYCVTLPRLRERREAFVDAWDFPVEFFDGVDYLEGDLLGIARSEGLEIRKPQFKPTLAIGLSHRLLWRHVLEVGDDCVTIFEDDARPTGEPWLVGSGDVYRWFFGDPAWVGTACYTATRTGVSYLLSGREAKSPDRIIWDAGFFVTGKSFPVCVNALKSYPPHSESEPRDWM